MGDDRLFGIRVLHVDDDPDALEVVYQLLASEGATVLSLASAAEAMRDLSVFRPDVLMLDLAMPVEDGLSLMRRVRQESSSKVRDVPAIALTGHGGAEQRDEALGAGFQVFIAKPTNVDTLVEAITSLAPRADFVQ